MKKFNSLKPEQQVEVYNKAFTYLHDHADYVHTLFSRNTKRIEPRAEVVMKPEQWNGNNWSWFINEESSWRIKLIHCA